MNNQDKTSVVDHIFVPYTPVIESIFFTEVVEYKYEIYLEGKKIVRQDVSTKLREELSGKGFTFVKTPKIKLVKRKEFAGVKIRIQKNYHKKKVKELVISIPSSSSIEFSEKRKIFISEIKKWAPDIEPRFANSDKFVRC